jgi:hypothetical protein
VLAEVFRICHTREIEVDHVEMFDVGITLVEIVDKVPNIYNTNEGWVVKKMKSEHVNRIVIILLIIYKKDKVQHFCNKYAMMISKVEHRES